MLCCATTTTTHNSARISAMPPYRNCCGTPDKNNLHNTRNEHAAPELHEPKLYATREQSCVHSGKLDASNRCGRCICLPVCIPFLFCLPVCILVQAAALGCRCELAVAVGCRCCEVLGGDGPGCWAGVSLTPETMISASICTTQSIRQHVRRGAVASHAIAILTPPSISVSL